MTGKIKKIAIVAIVTYLLIELTCFIFIEYKFKGAHLPRFIFQYDYKKYDFTIAEIEPVWGTWHYKESYTEKKQCFESAYHINSFGARDKERKMIADTNRTIFLGDSFIEGYGLNESERLTNQLESLSNREVLNFGCGYFTPTHEYLLYKELAHKFSHNTIIVGILPFNDMVESDTSFHEKDGFVHYQPYFQGTAPDYHLMYRENNISKSTFNKEGYYKIQNTTMARFTRVFKECSYWYNLYQFIKANRPVINENKEPYSGYYDCTGAQLSKLYFILNKLKEAAEGKRLIVVAIPVYNDLEKFAADPSPVFTMKMDSFCTSSKIEYIDLLPIFSKKVKDPRQLYLDCDGHWNKAANKIAAEIILSLPDKERK
ncbi:MAG: hypothetical protein ABIO04_08065 [Ferruginibacter sp.]